MTFSRLAAVTGHAIEALWIIRRLRVGELELAGAGRRFHSRAKIGPGVRRCVKVRAGQYRVTRTAQVAEAKLERAAAEPGDIGQEHRRVIHAFHRTEVQESA